MPDSCEDADCDKDSEMCIELENEEVKVAHCVPNSEFHFERNFITAEF